MLSDQSKREIYNKYGKEGLKEVCLHSQVISFFPLLCIYLLGLVFIILYREVSMLVQQMTFLRDSLVVECLADLVVVVVVVLVDVGDQFREKISFPTFLFSFGIIRIL